MTDIREKIKAKIERDSYKYGLAVAKHSYERGPMRHINGEPWEFDNRPDHSAKCAYRFGADVWAQRCARLVKALIAIENEVDMHYSSVGKWSKDMAHEAIEAFEKELEK